MPEHEAPQSLSSLSLFSACASSSSSSSSAASARKRSQQQKSLLQKSFLFSRNDDVPTSSSFARKNGANGDNKNGLLQRTIDKKMTSAKACSEKLVAEEFSSLSSLGLIYCDYNGCPPVSSRLIKSCAKALESTVLGNPHSNGNFASSSSSSDTIIRESRNLVLKHFNAPEFGEYSCVFANGGATSALQLVGDAFFSSDGKDGLSYAEDNHTSVLGLRNLVWSRGGDVFVLREGESGWTSVKVNDRGAKVKTRKKWFTNKNRGSRDRKHLLAYADESNFHGNGVREANVKRKIEEIRRGGAECFTVLDASKSAAMCPINLKNVEKELRPDFIVASAYKIFGYPTGVGFLLVSNRAMKMLEKNGNMNHKVFGGGTAKAIDASTNFFVAKENASGLERGTLPFQQIAALPKCFEWYRSIGGSETIRINAGHVGEVLASGLWNLRHANGKPVVEIYGSQWRHLAEHLKVQSDYDDRYEKLTFDGRKIVSLSTVAFNVLNDDGTHVGYSKVERALASRNIVVRTGCCCNPGACESIRKKKIENRVKKLYETKGKVCGDDMGVDATDGEPLGCVRASFGYASRVSDAKAMIETIEREFVCRPGMMNGKANETPERPPSRLSQSRPSPLVTISKINVFPIKSCAPFSVDKWYLLPSGLLFDRKYVLIEKQSGLPLTQKSHPRLVGITPSVETIDLEDVNGYAFTYLVLKSADVKDTLRIDLNEEEEEFDSSRESNISISVRGQALEARLVRDPAAHEWFSKILNVECCIALLKDETKRTFSNTSPILVASEQSAKVLGCDISRFRANIIVSEKEYEENVEKKKTPVPSEDDLFSLEKSWISNSNPNKNVGIKIRDEVVLGNGRFCHRCQSVAIDQTTGKRDEKTWEIIMRKAANTFGVSFDVMANDRDGVYTSNAIAVGDEIHSIHL